MSPTPLYAAPHEDAEIEAKTVVKFELKSELRTCYKVPGYPVGYISPTKLNIMFNYISSFQHILHSSTPNIGTLPPSISKRYLRKTQAQKVIISL
jgi:hypothetical protein